MKKEKSLLSTVVMPDPVVYTYTQPQNKRKMLNQSLIGINSEENAYKNRTATNIYKIRRL